MKKVLIAIIVLIALGFGYWTISPFFIDKRVSEEFPPPDTSGTELSQIKQQGSFEGFDSIHYGSGDMVVIETESGYVIRFEENFNVANGPDLYVGLGKDGEYREEAQIARLKGNVGSQNYVLPKEIDLKDYNEVWIWCRAFSVGFAKAKLKSI